VGLTITTQPAAEPVSTAEAKAHMRVDTSDDDTLIGDMNTAARELAESFQRRSYINTTWRWTLDGFPGHIPKPPGFDSQHNMRVPRSPLSSVSSIIYLTSTGATATLATTVYRVDTDTEPGRISLQFGQVWPSTRQVNDAVTIAFVAGFGATSTSVPEKMRTAVKVLCSDMYERRSSQNETSKSMRVEENKTATRLLWSGRIIEAA